MGDVGGKILFYDTNALLDLCGEDKLNDLDLFYTSSLVLHELEHIKVSRNKDEDVRYRARKMSRFLKENPDKYECIIVQKKHYTLLEDLNLEVSNDNLIIACAKLLQEELNKKVLFVTSDICCWNIASKVFELDTETLHETDNENYKGYIEKQFADEELAELYSNLNVNKFNMLPNEYLIIKNKDKEIVDKLKWNGEYFDILRYKTVQHKLMDKVKPKNVNQELLFDMLQDETSKLKIVQGLHGTGKTYIMIANALSLLEKGKFDKIIWVVQNQQVANTSDIGALPGGLEDKLKPYVSIFADKVGGQYGVDLLTSERKFEVIPLAFIRGRSFSNSIVMMSEAENTTIQHMKLLISRLEEDSILMIDGDFKQTDKEVFKNNNGLNTTIEKLKGQSEFAVVTLTDIERSKLANLASLLD